MQNPSPVEQAPQGRPAWTIIKLINWSTNYFTTHRVDSPRITAEMLLAHALGYRRIDLYLKYDQPLSQQELTRYKALVKRRIAREPVAYILESKHFWSLEVAVSPDVLIPRPETEGLVEAALKIVPEKKNGAPWRILEAGAGSGALIAALAVDRPQHLFFASDICPKALAVTGHNASRLVKGNKIHLFAGNWFAPLNPFFGGFELILSNPPYIPSGDIDTLQAEVSLYEPRLALDGGREGLRCISELIDSAPRFLADRGWLLLEIGYGQKEAVEAIAGKTGAYETICFHKDHGNIDRVVQLRKKSLSKK